MYEITSLIANGGQVKFIAAARFHLETRGRDQGSDSRVKRHPFRVFSVRPSCDASLSHSSIAIVRSELHHGSANNVAPSEQINVLVDFIKFEEFDAVTNLVLGGKRHDLTQVRVVAQYEP
jgi:hypothetical protein